MLSETRAGSELGVVRRCSDGKELCRAEPWWREDSAAAYQTAALS